MMETMGQWMLIATILSGANALMLAVLIVVWGRNYRTFGSGMTAGLAAFGIAMFVENAVAIYFFFSTSMLYAGATGSQQAVVVLRALQTVALVFLTYVTVK